MQKKSIGDCIIVRISAGLGNQLFQYAFGRNISLITGKQLYLDLSFFSLREEYRNLFALHMYNTDYELADLDSLKRYDSNILARALDKIRRPIMPGDYFRSLSGRVYQRSGVIADIYDLAMIKSPYFHGWWGGEHYFRDSATQIIEDLTLKEDYIKGLDRELIGRIKSMNTISIHIRRGDYLNNPYFHNLDEKYYRSAISALREWVPNPVFFVFSDDINWVRENMAIGDSTVFMHGNKDYEDLYYMSLCKHNIIANSTYSWWGAYLNRNSEKIVIAPKVWFDNEKAQKNYEEGSLIPDTWLQL